MGARSSWTTSASPRPQRDVREHDNRRATLQPLHVRLQPGELLGAEGTQTARLEIDDVDQTDEMHAGLVEAVPAGALRVLPEALEVALAVVTQYVVFARHIEHRRADPHELLMQLVEFLGLRLVCRNYVVIYAL